MTDLPNPLVSAEVDLRDFPFTPMYRSRLFGSGFNAKVSDEGWRAGVTLWLKSWDQVPAGTLPDDEVELCRLVELGRDVKTWRRIAKEALWGWFKATDGRLHHKVVAQGVIEAWQRKVAQRDRTEAARVAKAAKRQSQTEKPAPTEDVTSSVTEPVTEAATGTVTGSKGQGQGQGQGQGIIKEPAAAASLAAAGVDFEKRCRLVAKGEPCADGGRFQPILDWIAKGCPEAVILAAIEAAIRRASVNAGGFKTFAAFDGWIDREWQASRNSKPGGISRTLTPEEAEAARRKHADLVARGVIAA